MIIRKRAVVGEAGPIPEFGPQTWAKVSDAGGLGQYGAYVITLEPTDRRWLMAVCEAVEPLTVADVPHREYEQQRTNYKYAGISFAESQVRKALAQSFSKEALEKRYHFTEDKPGKD